MPRQTYHLHLKGYVGGYDFDSDYVDYVLSRNAENEVHVLIDSLGGSLATALSIVAAFRQHGNVHVHFVGMNASAATIASMGAKRITMDASAMYLVHKCSVEFFRWASANSDKLSDIIKEAKQMKSDLEKMDANVAQMYAAKTGKSPEDVLALMKKGGWLTAAEAKEYGFVDEVTDYAEDLAPVITDSIAADMGAAGIPVPTHVAKEQGGTMLNRFIEALTNLFKSNTNSNTQADMTPSDNQQQEQQQEQQAPEANAQQTQQPEAQQGVPANAKETPQQPSVEERICALETKHREALAAKDREIAALQSQIAELKKAPGDSTSHVVEDDKKDTPITAAEDYCATVNSARALFNAVG